MNTAATSASPNVVLHPAAIWAIEATRQQFFADVLYTALDASDWATYHAAGLKRIPMGDDHEPTVVAVILRPTNPAYTDNRSDARDQWQTIDLERLADAAIKITTGQIEISSCRMLAIADALLRSDAGMIDADLADCILRVAAFGEIVFD